MKLRSKFILIALLFSATPFAHAQALPGDSIYQVQATVTDAQGKAMAWRDLRGKPAVLSMFYTGCHMMCPLILENAKATQKQLPESDRDRMTWAMISLDPANDTPQALRDTARRYRAPADWRFLTPAVNDVRAIASVLDIRYRARSDGSINHTSALVLVDAQGRVLARTEIAGAIPDPTFLAAIRKALAAPSPQP